MYHLSSVLLEEGNCPFIDLYTHSNKRLRVLVDSGSHVSLLSSYIASLLTEQDQTAIRPKEIELRSATDHVVRTSKRVLLRLQLDAGLSGAESERVTVFIEAYIVPSLRPQFILGASFLNYYKSTLSMEDRTLSLSIAKPTSKKIVVPLTVQPIYGPHAASLADDLADVFDKDERIVTLPRSDDAVPSYQEARDRLVEAADKTRKAISDDQRKQLRDILDHFPRALAPPERSMPSTLPPHRIPIGNNQPPRSTTEIRATRSEDSFIKDEIQSLLEKGIIERCPSPPEYRAQLVVVNSGQRKKRLCVDYRQLNGITERDSYMMPRADEILDSLGGAAFFSKLDLKSGYHQIDVALEDRHKTAFICKPGEFRFCKMPFGLKGAPATFQRIMDSVLEGLNGTICFVYLDDIIIFSESIEQHMRDIRAVFERLHKAALYVNVDKCELFVNELSFLGHGVNAEGRFPQPDKVSAIVKYPAPQTVTELQRFLGMITFYRQYIRGHGHVAAPLYTLLKKDQPFVWSSECQSAFDELKRRLCDAPILVHPNDKNALYSLHTDASTVGIGAVLMRQDHQHGQPLVFNKNTARTVAYYGRKLSSAERNYYTTEIECLAIVAAMRNFRWLLDGKQFLVITDHSCLSYLNTMAPKKPRLTRWMLELQIYDFKVFHNPGRNHVLADALSRAPPPAESSHTTTAAFQPACAAASAADSTCPPLLSLDNIKQAQASDPLCKAIKTYLNGGPLPTSKSGVSKTLVSALCKDMVIWNDVLYSVWYPDSNKHTGQNAYWRVVIPDVAALREAVLVACHDDCVGGAHLSFARTYETVRTRFFWQAMGRDVEEYTKACVECAARKTPHVKPSGGLQPISTSHAWEIMAADIMGPLPTSASGNTHLLVVTDLFTKWTVAFGIADTTAETIARVFVKNIFTMYSVPAKILTDRAANFNSNLANQIYKLYNTYKLSTTGYHPQCDGQTERFNHTLCDMIAAYVNRRDFNDWDDYALAACQTYNATIHSTTKMTPYYALFHREPKLPLDWVMSNYDSNNSSSSSGIQQQSTDATLSSSSASVDITSEYAKTVQRHLQMANKWIQEHSNQAKEKQKQQYDKHRRLDVSYKAGDTVYLTNEQMTNKLDNKWIGPFKITEKHNDLNYTIENIENPAIVRRVHISRLKPGSLPAKFVRDNKLLPEGGAAPSPESSKKRHEDDREYSVDFIRAHEDRKDGRYYLIHWLNFHKKDETWEHEDDCKNAPLKVLDYWRKATKENKAPAKTKPAVKQAPATKHKTSTPDHLDKGTPGRRAFTGGGNVTGRPTPTHKYGTRSKSAA